MAQPMQSGKAITDSALLEVMKDPSSREMVPGLVSIVIPCYQGARYLRDALESCIRQTCREIEVVVVDDASTDGSLEIAEHFRHLDSRVRVIRKSQNGGVARAFNAGFSQARGEFFTRLAQDDFFREDAIELMRESLQQNPEVGLVYCDYQIVDETGSLNGQKRVPEHEAVLSLGNRLGLCVMWRRAVWEAVGEFNPAFDTAEDYEYWLRVSGSYLLRKCLRGAPLFVRHHDAMGSVVRVGQQEEATSRVLELAYNGVKPWQRGWWLRQKALSNLAYSTASDFTATGMQSQALTRMLRSFLLWPIPYRRHEVTTRWARPKLLANILLRMLRLARTTPPAHSNGAIP